MRKHFAVAAGWLLFLSVYQGCAPERGGEKEGRAEAVTPLPASCVEPAGEFGTRLKAATANLLTRTDVYSLESFASSAAGRPGALWWDWPGDQIGRWFSVLHGAEAYGWTTAAGLRAAEAAVILPLQNEKGYFGPLDEDASKDVRLQSGNAFALRGLIDAYADTGDARFLEAARKLARYFEAGAPFWETGRDGVLHEFYGHCIDGLAALYELGGDEEALALARRLAGHAGRTPHTHHSLSLCRGLIDLARVTGEREHLARAGDYLSWCREHRTASGGLPESMPESYQDEGCGLADWIVSNLMMYEATGERRYVDDAEHTLVNHFFMNQFPTGGFGHMTLSQEIVGGRGWQGWGGRFGSENRGCCSLWGQWALGQAGRYIVTTSEDAVRVNLYPEVTVALPGGVVRLEISSDFPRMSRASVKVVSLKSRRFALELRVPPWADAVTVLHRGKEILPAGDAGLVRIERSWRGTEVVDITFISGLHTVPWPQDKPRGCAVFDGPLCLGLPGDLEDVDLSWAVLVDESGRPLPDEAGGPQVVDPSGRVSTALEPISRRWFSNDVDDPVRRRILFETKWDGRSR